MPTITFTLLWNVGLATVLAILVGILSRSKLLQHRPALTHALWLLVLAKLITPPLIPLPVLPSLKVENVEYEPRLIEQGRNEGDLVASFQMATEAPAITDELARSPTWSIPWSVILVGVSGCGTLILIASSLMQLVRVSRILRRAAACDAQLNRLAQTAATRMGMQRIPVVCAVDASITPLLWVRPSGPVVVMPTRLVEQMSDEQVTCILCHELAHYVRRDHWSNAFAFLVAALFWWNPVAWWARREMQAAQEVCCDGLVLAAGATTRRCYAETLFQALEFVQTDLLFQPTLVSGFGSSSSLLRRFEMIVSLKVSRRLSWWATTFFVVSIAAMLCVPVRGQSDTENAKRQANENQRRAAETQGQAEVAQEQQRAAAEEKRDPPLADEPEWKKKFNAVYQLKEGEYVKRVPAPLIPERKDFVSSLFPGADDKAVIRWATMGVLFVDADGKTLSYRGLVSTDAVDFDEPSKQVRKKRMTLRGVIASSTGRVTPEVVFDDDAKNQDVFMECDFVIRKDSPLERLLPDLQKALNKCEFDNGKTAPVLSLKEEEQEVYVVGGKFKIVPRKWRQKDEVDVYADEGVLNKEFTQAHPEPNADVGTSIYRDPPLQFVRQLGSFVNKRIVWDTELPINLPFRAYTHHRWENKATAEQQAADRDPEKVLKNVFEQTGLTFTKQMRKVQVLYIVTP